MEKSEITPRWLQWAREIQALAQSGEAYSMNQWQSQRYQRLMGNAAEIEFYSDDLIPQNLSGKRTKPRHIDDAFAAHHNRTLPAVFE